MRVLVTGASGVVGRALLARDDLEVVSLGRRRPDGARRHVDADLSAPGFLASAPRDVDAIIHLAQSRRFREHPAGAADVFAINTRATADLLDFAVTHSIGKVVLASSGSVYAPSRDALREDAPLDVTGPGTFYARSKLCAELLAGPYVDLLDVVTLRFFFVYGPHQDRRMLLPRLVDHMRAQRSITLQGAGGLRFTPTHARDAAAAVAAASRLTGSHTINVAGPEAWTLRDAVGTLAEAHGLRPTFAHDDEAPASWVADTGRMRALLGAPSIPLAEGAVDLA